MDQLAPGTLIDGKYLIQEPLGEGGLGVVYRAVQKDLNREVAIKIVNDASVVDSEYLQRFEREARILGKLKHKNIVEAYSFGQIPGGNPYIAMELVHGQTLQSLLADGKPLEWVRAASIGIQICDGMNYAHEQGVTHRDLKPQNIMLMQTPDPDTVKLLDFGLSGLSLDGSRMQGQKLTQTGALIGTIHYMSPEVCAGRQATSESDVYALGCILYQCLTGRTPLECDNPVGMLHKHVTEMPARFGKLELENVPTELELAVFKAMQKAPEDRFRSMDSFKETLSLILKGERTSLTEADVILKNTTIASFARQGQILLLISLISVVGIGAAVFLKLDKRARNDNLKILGTREALLTGRESEISRARSLMAAALEAKRKGNFKQAEENCRRAMQALYHTYHYNEPKRNFALRDAEIVSLFEQITRDIPVDTSENIERYLDRIEGNDLTSLNLEEGAKFLLAHGRICTRYKRFNTAACKYSMAISRYAAMGKAGTAREIMDEFSNEITCINPQMNYYKELAVARIAACNGEVDKAKAALDRALLHLNTAFPAGTSSQRFYPLLEMVAIETQLNDRVRIDRSVKEIVSHIRAHRSGQIGRTMLDGDLRGDDNRVRDYIESADELEQLSRTLKSNEYKDLISSEKKQTELEHQAFLKTR